MEQFRTYTHPNHGSCPCPGTAIPFACRCLSLPAPNHSHSCCGSSVLPFPNASSAAWFHFASRSSCSAVFGGVSTSTLPVSMSNVTVAAVLGVLTFNPLRYCLWSHSNWATIWRRSHPRCSDSGLPFPVVFRAAIPAGPGLTGAPRRPAAAGRRSFPLNETRCLLRSCAVCPCRKRVDPLRHPPQPPRKTRQPRLAPIGAGVAPFQWTVKGLGFMQLPGSSSRRRWGIADQGPGDDDGGYTIPR